MNIIRNLFAGLNETYPDRVAYFRARTMAMLGISFTIFAVVFFLGQVVPGGESERVSDAWSIVASIVVVFLFIGSVVLVERGYSIVSRLFVYGLVFLVSVASAWYYGSTSIAVGYYMLLLVVGGALFGRIGLNIGMVATLAIMIVGMVFTDMPMRNVIAQAGITVSAVILGGLTLNFFSGNLQDVLTEATQSAAQLRAVAEIGQVASGSLDSDALMMRIVDMVQERMGFYHVQVFLVDDARKNAVLAASTGTVGAQLLARGHRLPVGSASVIGQATQTGNVVNASDVGLTSGHRKNEFLPDTRSELAVPFFDGETVIGALDVQSTESLAFNDDVIEVLQIVATQVSVGVRNARLFEQLQNTLESNQRLYKQAQENLQEVERMNRLLTGQGWGTFLAESRKEYGVQVDAGQVTHQAAWTPALQAAFHSKQMFVEERAESNLFSVPLEVRGQVLGAIEVELPASVSQQDARETAEAVATRLAMTLDNNRLFEEARNLAEQEHLVNEIGGRLQSTTDVNEMLQIAVQELQHALGAERGAVRLRSALRGGTPEGA